MLIHFLRFEIRFWTRGFMLWVFTLIMGLFIFAASSTDKVIVGRALENTFRNAPFVVQNFYAMAAMLTLLMVTAFVNSAAARDFQFNTHQIIFSTPIRKRDYLLGRYLGATLVSIIPMLGISLGIIIAKYMPWVDAERWGPIDWNSHLQGVLVFAIPNTFFMAAIIFAIAALTRSTITSFIGALCLMVGYGIAENFMTDIDNETIAKLIDPFGSQTFNILTKYWTVSDKNTRSIGLEGMMLLNRIIWVAVGFAVFGFTYWRFRFEERARKGKKSKDAPPVLDQRSIQIPGATHSYGGGAQWAQFLGQVKIEFSSLIKTTTFIVILIAGMLNTGFALAFNANEGFGLSSLPVTYWILTIIRGTLYLFLVSIVTYFAGVLVWRERDARADEIYDALPYKNWIPYAAKFTALIGALTIILMVAMGAGIITQAYHHYLRFQLGLYIKELFLLDLLTFIFLAFMAFLIHVISPNKYVGYFGFIAFMIVNAFIWRPLDVATRMVRFASTPGYTYSDMYLYAPYITTLFWFHLYWILFCGLLAIAALVLWPRGKETRLMQRLWIAKLSFTGALRPLTAILAIAWIACAGWVFYNTQVLNTLQTENQVNRRRADYEKTYKKYENINQPPVQSIRYWIDVYPEQRNLVLRGEQIAANKGAEPIAELHLKVARGYDNEVQIERASLKANDERQLHRIYQLSPPLAPGESLKMNFTVKAATKGFEQSLRHENLVQNGTFFNNAITPQIGYQAGEELTERNERKKQGLEEREPMQALERNCTAKCGNHYISNNSDWVSVETVMSTSPDQIAVAPGTLLKEWNENGRRYFQYKLDRDSLNFYSFISARYEVAREEFDGIRSEVYYHREHPWNVKRMQEAIRKTLDYCKRNFGPYAHKQARIIEFPRFSSFAQAFPGTMPYSESIGFIANLNHPDDIDKVFYVVAHEMGHQWWAHQVMGANMQGATLLSETLAQYTALMVMEREYGRDMMRKFLAYEMDRYLRARGSERLKERPLMKVEASQGYVHYAKGSAALYYIKEMIGEAAVNQALKRVVDKWAYKGPPYPTSYELVDALQAVTPPDLQYILKDLFEDITLFANRTLVAKAKKRNDGKFDITIEVETRKMKADDKGLEKEVPVNDWMEIGAFTKPAKGKKYGETLHRERVRVTTAKNVYNFTVEKEPEKAGIDPFSLLVDRIPEDNLKKISME